MEDTGISIEESPHKPTAPYHPHLDFARFAYRGPGAAAPAAASAGEGRRMRAADIVAKASSGSGNAATSTLAARGGSGRWGTESLAIAARSEAALQPTASVPVRQLRRAAGASRIPDSDDDGEAPASASTAAAAVAAAPSLSSAGATGWLSGRPGSSSSSGGAASAPAATLAVGGRATRAIRAAAKAAPASTSAESAPVRRLTRNSGRAPAAKQRRRGSDDDDDDDDEDEEESSASEDDDDDDDDDDSDASYDKPNKRGKRQRKPARGAAAKGRSLRQSTRSQRKPRTQIDDSDEDEYHDDDDDDDDDNESEEEDYDGGSDGEASAGGGDSIDSDVSVGDDDTDTDSDGGGSSDGNSSERSAKRRLRRKERTAARGAGPVTRGARRLVKAGAAATSPQSPGGDAEVSIVEADGASCTSAAAAAAPARAASLAQRASGGADVDDVDDDDDDIVIGARRSTASASASAAASQAVVASAAAGSRSADTRDTGRGSDSGDEGGAVRGESSEASAARAEAMDVGALLRLERSERKQLAHLVSRAVRVKADTMKALGLLLPAAGLAPEAAVAVASADGGNVFGSSSARAADAGSSSGAGAKPARSSGGATSSSATTPAAAAVGVITPAHLEELLGIGVSDLPVAAQHGPPGPVSPGLGAGSASLALKPHQLLGVNWLHLLFRTGVAGCVVADAMGLGKTPQTCVFLSYLAVQADRCAARAAQGGSSRGGEAADAALAGDAAAASGSGSEPQGEAGSEYSDPGMFLIVTPASTVGNWLRELARWAPSLRVGVFRGGARRGVEMASNASAAAGPGAVAATSDADGAGSAADRAGEGAGSAGTGASSAPPPSSAGSASSNAFVMINDDDYVEDTGKGRAGETGSSAGAIALDQDRDSDNGSSPTRSSLNTSYDGRSNKGGASDSGSDSDAALGDESDDAEDAAKRAAAQLRGGQHRRTPLKAKGAAARSDAKGSKPSRTAAGAGAGAGGTEPVLPRGGRKVDVLLTTYSMFDRSGESANIDRSFLLALGPFGVVVLDEGHAVKNANSARHKHLSSLSSGARMRVLLSGTPVQNDLRELLSLLGFVAGKSAVRMFSDETLQAMEGQLTGGAGKAKGQAASKQAKGKQGRGRKAVSDDEDAEQPPLKDRVAALLRRICEPYILRRRKGDVLLSLPSKTDVTVPLAMLPGQAAIYDAEIAAARQAAGVPAPQPETAPATSAVQRIASAAAVASAGAASHVLDLTGEPSPTPQPMAGASAVGGSSSNADALPGTAPSTLQLPAASPMPTPMPMPLVMPPSASFGASAAVSPATITASSAAALAAAAPVAGTSVEIVDLKDDATPATAEAAVAGDGSSAHSSSAGSNATASRALAAGPSVIDIDETGPQAAGAAAAALPGPAPASVIDLDSDADGRDGAGGAASGAGASGSAGAVASAVAPQPARSAAAGKAGAASIAAAAASAASAAAASAPTRKTTRRTAGGVDPLFAGGLDHVHAAVASMSAASAGAGSAAAGGRGGKSKAPALTARAATSLFTALRKSAQHPILSQNAFADPSLRQSVAAALHRCGAFGARPDNSLSAWLGSPEPAAAAAGSSSSTGGGGSGGGVTVERIAAELAGMSDFAIHGMCVAFGGTGPKQAAVPTSTLSGAAGASASEPAPSHPLANAWFALGSKAIWAHTGGYQPDVDATAPVRAALATAAAAAETSVVDLTANEAAAEEREDVMPAVAEAVASLTSSAALSSSSDGGAGAGATGTAAAGPAPSIAIAMPTVLPTRFRGADEARAFLRSCRLPLSSLFGAAKVQWLAGMLPSMIVRGRRVLLFSQWTMVLDVLQDVLDALRIRCCRLDGSTAVEERQPIIDAFTAGNIPVFLLSTRAGGLGLNLTAADTVVIYDSDLNPHVDAQAVDRAHRIGQTRPVSVYRLLCKGTVDETICRIADRKAALDAALVLSSRNAGAAGAVPGLGRAFDDGSSPADEEGVEGTAAGPVPPVAEDVTSLLLAALQRR